MRAAIASLPARERKVISMYYYAEATMKQIGTEIGVNESRVSQLHARAVQRLKKALGAEVPPAEAAAALRPAILSFQQTMRRMRMAKVDMPGTPGGGPAVCAAEDRARRVRRRARRRSGSPPRGRSEAGQTQATISRAARSRSFKRNGLASQRQPLSSRKRSASVPATSPVTNMIRRAICGRVSSSSR